VTGMRQGEACRLGRGDVDLNAETVTIADSKFGNYAEGAVMPSPVTGLLARGSAARESSA